MNDLQHTSSTSTLATWTPDGSPLPVRVMERIFARLSATYGATALAGAHAGSEPELVMQVWSEGLAGFTVDEIKRGLAARPSRFAPNLPEFMHLCRPALDPEYAWHEAARAMREGFDAFAWSHVVVRQAALGLGYELRTSTFEKCRKRWTAALDAQWSSAPRTTTPDANVSLAIEGDRP